MPPEGFEFGLEGLPVRDSLHTPDSCRLAGFRVYL